MQIVQLSNNEPYFESYIQNNKGIFYIDFLSDDELRGFGYKRVQDALPKELSPQEKLEQLKAEFIKTIDGILNKVAQSKGYDDIISARSYAGYDNEFRAESEAFGRWSAEVWKWAYTLQDKVEKGEVDVSSLSIDNVLKDMPQAPSFKG